MISERQLFLENEDSEINVDQRRNLGKLQEKGTTQNKTRHSYIYMLSIVGQTAGPIGLKFFVDTHGWPMGVKGYFKKIHGQCRAL